MRHRRRARPDNLPTPAKDPLMAVYQDGALSTLFHAMQIWLSRGDFKEASRTAAMLLRALPEERPGAAFLDLMRCHHADDADAFAEHVETLSEQARTARLLSR